MNVRFRSLRTRVMAWYGALIALCLVAYSIAIAVVYAKHVEAEWNQAAHEDVELAARSLVLDAYGRPAGPLAHVLKVFLIDARGVVREIYTTSYLYPEVILNDIKTLRLEDGTARRAGP